MASPISFADYPDAIEGPDVRYAPKEEANPVFTGIPLALATAVFV